MRAFVYSFSIASLSIAWQEDAIMVRMHAPGKGISSSELPYRRSVPTWVKMSSDEVKEMIAKLAKKGRTPSQIGVMLRDSNGIAQVKLVTGNKILRILKVKGLALPFQRTCTTLSRRLSLSASIWRSNARIRIPSSGSFSSRAVSIALLATTRRGVVFPPTGSMNHSCTPI
ncbi:small ribosomal subunit protein uS15-like isoform X2 [Sycon ciliatum]|uniref:small ribosomal subunit protein uS15-like isoform X2 n=1 Tax=Sycon ciliatum TaxID=27933 RepID=UPI0031F6114B